MAIFLKWESPGLLGTPWHPARETQTSTAFTHGVSPRGSPVPGEKESVPSTSANSCIFSPTLQSHGENSCNKGPEKSCSRELYFAFFIQRSALLIGWGVATQEEPTW